MLPKGLAWESIRRLGLCWTGFCSDLILVPCGLFERESTPVLSGRTKSVLSGGSEILILFLFVSDTVFSEPFIEIELIGRFSALLWIVIFC